MSRRSVAIVGASADRSKFGNKSVRAHQQAGYDVFPIHPQAQTIEGLNAFRSLTDVSRDRIDRIVFYVPPAVGLGLLDDVAGITHQEFWLSPGTESDAILDRSDDLGLQVTLGCTIVDLGINPADLSD